MDDTETKVVEQCRISPSHGGAAEQSLPLLYFDIVRFPAPHVQTLFFYNFPCSKPHFFDTVLPHLKTSLSLALKHFLPLAGNIIFPLNNSGGMPFSHYSSSQNDSVSLTVAVSDSDFSFLTGDSLKDSDYFHHHFIPEIPSPDHSSDSIIKVPVLAFQITLFPNQGICVGFAFHHAICDGAAILFFLQTWASINKFNGDNHLKALPVYDRTAVQDSGKLNPLAWEMMKNSMPTPRPEKSLPVSHKLRASFHLSNEQVSKLKNFIVSRKPGVAHVSSYTAMCARVWSCLAEAAGETVSDDEVEYLSMGVNCRGRLRPPLPGGYFGNCLVPVIAECAHGRLRGEGGFLAAAEAMGEALDKSLKSEKGVLDGCVERYVRFMELKGKGRRVVGVNGSPTFDLSAVDFGWRGGGTHKVESLHIDVTGSFSLYKLRGGIDVGVSLPKLNMDAFASIFNKYDQNIHANHNVNVNHVSTISNVYNYEMQASKL